MCIRRLMSWTGSTQTVTSSQPNLHRHLFFVLLFFLLQVMLYICGPVYAENTVNKRGVNLFVPSEVKIPTTDVDEENRDVVYFNSPSFVAVDGVAVVFAEAEYTDDDNANVDIVARYIATEGNNWYENITEDNGSKWKTQLIMQKDEEENYISQLRNPVAVVKNNKIYLLAVNYNKSKNNFDSKKDLDWNFELAVGEVASEDENTGKTIQWYMAKSPLSTLTEQFKDRSLNVLSYDTSAFITEDDSLVFVMRAEKDPKYILAIIHLRDIGREKDLEWWYAWIAGGCYFPYFFGWKEKLIMVPTSCRGGGRNVQESTDMGKTWTDAIGPYVRVWDNLKDKGDLTTVTIEDKTVLLFTQLINTGTEDEPKYEVYLGITDGNRVHNVGSIASDGHYFTPNGLLYTNGALFLLYQQWNNGPKGIFITHIKDELEKIKSVLRIWAENDKYLLRPREETSSQGNPLKAPCLTPMPTDGLVGLLSNRCSITHWHDEYLFMDATVRGGIKVEDGFDFFGIGSGARWSIGKQGEIYRYNFAKYGLTVVASVAIHKVPQSETSLLTFSGTWGEERVGLWYNKYNEWIIKFGNVMRPAGIWETGKTYCVTLMLKNNNLLLYVNGNHLGDMFYVSAPERLFDIEHLFIGGCDDERINGVINYVTVKNVFLYNRPFTTTELKTVGRE